MDKKIAIIGSGNAFFKDEGMGLYAAKYLKENYIFSPDCVDIIDGGTLGFGLMPLLQEYDEVIIANTASDTDRAAGEIVQKSGEEFLEGALVKKTANEVEIAEMLQICALGERMANVALISVVPEDILSVAVGLSACMHAVWQEYIEKIVSQLQTLGVAARYKPQMDLADILDIFAAPSIEHAKGF